jgi:hypothetical protein
MKGKTINEKLLNENLSHTINLGGKEIPIPMYGSKEEFLFIAMQEAFSEIDKLKETINTLNYKINTLSKSR